MKKSLISWLKKRIPLWLALWGYERVQQEGYWYLKEQELRKRST